MRLIAPSEYRRMPWKNGGGTTWEVAVHPAGADWSSFAWRVSIAEVERDGPFSSFPGIDRTLVVLAGSGMRLSGLREESIELRPYGHVAFAGEAAIDCALLDGPTRDFNMMTRRSAGHADVRVVQDARATLPEGSTYLCHAAAGSCACAVDAVGVEVSEGHTLIAAGKRFEVDATRGAVAIVAVVHA